MKLYTEEEIKKRLLSLNVTNTDIFIDLLKPIELPSDEEIERAMIDKDIVRQQGYCHCFLEGAIWMKNRILNQNK